MAAAERAAAPWTEIRLWHMATATASATDKAVGAIYFLVLSAMSL